MEDNLEVIVVAILSLAALFAGAWDGVDAIRDILDKAD